MRETGRVSHNVKVIIIRSSGTLYVLVRYPLVKILNEIYFLAKRGPDRITTVPVRAAGRTAAAAVSMFIHNIFLLANYYSSN